MRSLFYCGQDSRKPFLIFLFLYLFYCVATYGHFGVTWDEFGTYIMGGHWIKYYLHQPNDLFTAGPVSMPDDQSHSFFNGALDRMLSFSKVISPERIHLVNLLLAIPIFFCFFELLRVHLRDWRLALMGPVVLVLTPRFFGDIPANALDVPFAVIYFVCLSAIVLRREWFKNTWLQNILLGVLFGWAIGLRILALILFPIYVIFRIYEDGLIQKKWTIKGFGKWLVSEIVGIAMVFLISQIVLSLLWPYIGKDYFHHIIDVLRVSPNISFTKKMLFMGQWYEPLKHFLWYYLPGWMLIVTPLFILGFAFYSLARVKTLYKNKIYFVMVLALTSNLAIFLILKPLIFNGLRHFLFLVPILSFLACLGIIDFFVIVRWRAVRVLAAILIAVNVVMVTTDMVRLYPYDYVYFNELVGGLKGANGKFETDYWGASLREATEWLRDNEIANLNGTYKVKMTCDPWQQQTYFSPKMMPAHENDADYQLLLNGLADDSAPLPGQVIHTVEREGVPLSFVVKVKK
jgi:hypothetical protein